MSRSDTQSMYRRRRVRTRMAPVVQSYKQVKNTAPVSRAAGTQFQHTLTTGVDNYTGPSANNNEIPTGAVVKYMEIQHSAANLVGIASFLWITIQLVRTGQSAIDAQAVGGNAQRNQVHLQIQKMIGQNQNVNTVIRFKVPKKFQRVREGDKWIFTTKSDTIFTEATQSIYKFYR